MNMEDPNEALRQLNMSIYDLPDLPFASKYLADVLDIIGFSEKDRTTRVQYGVSTQMLNVTNEMLLYGGAACTLLMGSIIEGTTTSGMGSDADFLFFEPSLKAYCNKENIDQATGFVLLRDETTPSGYTKLQFVQQGCIIDNASDMHFDEIRNWFYHFEEDGFKGRLVLKHFRHLSPSAVGSKRHGPAKTRQGRVSEYTIDKDYVMSITSDDVTTEMEEWYKRDRKYDWPSKETRDLFRTLGLFMVAASYPTTPEKQKCLEWRMSFSLQERHLMLHLNPTQYHCFMLLKLIKKFHINPQFGDILTSYQCKTLLFYTIEAHEQNVWFPNNLISCLRMCLILLHEWISVRYIPNYFIPGENMFMKMNAALGEEKHDDLKRFLWDMCNDWRFLTKMEFNNLGLFFRQKIHDRQVDPCASGPAVAGMYLNHPARSLVPSSDSDDHIHAIKTVLDYLNVVQAVLQSSNTCSGHLCKTFEETILKLYTEWFVGRTHTLHTTERLHELYEQFQFRVEDIEQEPREHIVKTSKSSFQITLGAALAAKYFQTQDAQYLVESDRYLELGKSVDPITSMLVKATVLLKQTLYDDGNAILDTVEVMGKDQLFSCACYGLLRTNHRMVGARRQHVDLSFPCCYYFQRYERDILPAALSIKLPMSTESHSPAVRSIHETARPENKWVDTVAVDPVMHLYYLQFLMNEHSRPGRASVALQKFEDTLFGRLAGDWLGHSDTWLNVLGDVFENNGWTQLALRCLKYSHKMRPLP